MALIVREGWLTSSIRYRSRRDGRARNRRVTAGRIVHTVSICCASRIVRQDSLFTRRLISAYPTMDVTSVRISIAWS